MAKKIVIHWGGGAVTKGVCGATPPDRKQVVQTKSLVTCKRCKARIRQLSKKKVTRKSKSETVAGQKKYHRGGQVKGYTFGEALHSKSWP